MPPFPHPAVWKVGWVSNETAEAPSPQMGGLEIISTPRYDGRGPDGSLKRLSIFV